VRVGCHSESSHLCSCLAAARLNAVPCDCAELLNEVVDDSDPDLDLPQVTAADLTLSSCTVSADSFLSHALRSQIQHLLQTAEACRKLHPDKPWFHLAGFMHDIGKILAHPDFGSQAQWAVVGDTHPVGCAFDPSIVYSSAFESNPDAHDARYTTPCGIYQAQCGLDAVTMSWGHDEYAYQVMLGNGCTLPPEAHAIVRFHSFYAWHRDGAYKHLCNDTTDVAALAWVQEFNRCDLYSKSIETVDVDAVKPYYVSLARKYFPTEVLCW
jgi:inositol oxygenase